MVHIVKKVEGISMLRIDVEDIKKTPNNPVEMKATVSEKTSRIKNILDITDKRKVSNKFSCK